MWALIVDGSINKIFKYPTAFKHPTTGVQYPRNWITLATDSEKKMIGLIEITYSGSYKDGNYYNNYREFSSIQFWCWYGCHNKKFNCKKSCKLENK